MPSGIKDTSPRARIEYGLPPDLGRRYAEASGDYSPYTFDDNAARALGLPAAIMGGICTMSYAIRAIVDGCCDGRAARLKRIALRFSRFIVLRPDQRLEVRMWSDPQAVGCRLLFEVQDAAGDTVVTNGMAEIAA